MPSQESCTVAFRQAVLKVHSRCNLACDYCYVYEAVDQSWRSQPMSIAPETVRLAGERIAEHAKAHGVDVFRVTLHGGEPLLVGHEGLRRIVDGLRAAVGGVTDLRIGLQTNGVLVDEQFAQYFASERIRVGISVDGGREANDRHRRYANGRSSYDDVVRAVELMRGPATRDLFAGLLVTVDPVNDPVRLYRDLVALQPGQVDLLLPHATWETPPPAAQPGKTVYGDWLVAFFDDWYDHDVALNVRIFTEAMRALLGGVSRSEAVGLSAPESLVIETDGSYERTDALKIAFPGAAATGLSVARHSLDDVLAHPAVSAGLSGLTSLSGTCQACPIVAACGGGLYPHRYRALNGFDNPSVYCHDLGRLISHIGDRIAADLSRRADHVLTP